MRPARLALAVGSVLLAVAVAGCGLIQSSQRIGIQNGTDVPLMLHVNGAWVGTYAPGVTAEAPLGGHGGPSYSIETLSPSGAVLHSWAVTIEELELADDPGEGISSDVLGSCGWIRLWIGVDTGDAPPTIYDPLPCP